MEMQFGNWLENEDMEWATSEKKQQKLLSRTSRVAHRWGQQNGPRMEKNDPGIEIFVEAHADEWKNGEAIASDLARKEVYQIRYNKQIAQNLLQTNDERLKSAKGVVSNHHMPEFSFCIGADCEPGSLLIRHPPLAFDDVDKKMLDSVIVHELDHAADWLNPEFEGVEPSGKYRFNWKKYADNIYEARAYYTQLMRLLKSFKGDVNKVEAALEGKRPTPAFTPQEKGTKDYYTQQNLISQPQSPFRLSPKLMNVARAFLSKHRKQNENFSKWVGAPLLAASTMFQPAADKTVPSPVAQQQQDEVQLAAKSLYEIINLLLFRNFVEIS